MFQNSDCLPESDIQYDFKEISNSLSLHYLFGIELVFFAPFQNTTHTGYMSLCAAMNRTLDSGVDLINPEFYAKVDEEKLDEYLKGDNEVSCPLIKERVQCLNGKVSW